MKFFCAHAVAIGLLVVGFSVQGGRVMAQEMPPAAKPTAEHQWLEKFVGQWATDCSANMGPDQPAMECKGTMSSRNLGGFWVINEMKGEMSGAPMVGIQTVGFDPDKEKFVGTWIDSSTSFMWKYEGSLDEDKTTLTLNAKGPNFFAEGKLANFQDIYEFTSDDEFLLKSQIQGEDGKWIVFMSGKGTRVK
ncbi:DUF1579 domain-containing protein [Rhodopirellula sp. MGV]|uniref:DUF1579 domain-containing protein n=1 Tax=Rhodopirellula sp. MGV TaxID=2023130 RepID=UPI001179F99B|nr:DUF1579 domain-containing protein [Rhodopirellula sp. MGV]